MKVHGYINGERYIINDTNETKKYAFSTEIQDSLNKIIGMTTAEEKRIKTSSIEDQEKKTRIRNIHALQRRVYKLLTFPL